MSLPAEVIELDQFRRMREALNALSAMRSPVREVRPLQAINWYLGGVVEGARVATVFGDLPVEALRPRDEVRTYSGASASVQVVDQIHLDQDFLRRNAGALPIRIPAHAIGNGKPASDLFVSPGQELCLNAHIASTFHKASTLSTRFRMDLTFSTGVTYYRFHFGVPTVVQVGGVWMRVMPWE